MIGPKTRKFGAAIAIGQGLLAAIAPGPSAKVTRKLIGKQFDNADMLTPTPAYLRQIRASGIGLVAAGIATLALETAAEAPTPEDKPTEEQVDE